MGWGMGLLDNIESMASKDGILTYLDIDCRITPILIKMMFPLFVGSPSSNCSKNAHALPPLASPASSVSHLLSHLSGNNIIIIIIIVMESLPLFEKILLFERVQPCI
jgi:hypothetical protein